MKKIISIFNGDFPESTFEFAMRLNDLKPALLTGVFLPQIGYASLWNYAIRAKTSLLVLIVKKGDTTATQRNISRSESLCRKSNINYRVRKYFPDFTVPDLRKETRFADLAILGEPANDKVLFQDIYLKEALEIAECVVLVIPKQMVFPAGNILAYGGNESSVYAIKQFTYLFPEFASNETQLVTVNEESTETLPDEQYIEELVSSHFPQLTKSKIEIDHRKYFSTWVGVKKNSILVTGSFGRPALSQLFKKKPLIRFDKGYTATDIYSSSLTICNNQPIKK